MVVVTGSGFPLNFNSSGSTSSSSIPADLTPIRKSDVVARNVSTRPAPQTSGETPSAVVQSPVTASADQRLNSYIYFLASLRAEARQERGGSSEFSGTFSEELAEVSENIASFTVGVQSSSSADVSLVQIQTGEETGDAIAIFAAAIEFEFRASVTATVSVGRAALDGGDEIIVEAEIELDLQIDLAILAQGGSLQTNSQSDANQSDPLALDIDGDGQIALREEQAFDINADGQVDRTSFTTGRDVFLALDRNLDGRINDGSELFGDQWGAANGFIELARYDDNRDGQIDAADLVYSQLRGVREEEGRLAQYSLAELGVAVVSLNYANIYQPLEAGNAMTQVGRYQTSSGESRLAADLLLRYRSTEAVA